ncbi:MAG: glycosyltransferase [Acidobacteria bacterium]|nr:glycosyltransferase [Acidobacteriota bacterium]
MWKKVAKVIFLVIAPILLGLMGLLLLCSDLLCHLQTFLGKKSPTRFEKDLDSSPQRESEFHPQHASIVIPNWNGKDLLEKYLPSVIQACSPSDEIIVVDNGSADGSADFVRQHFPQVRVLALERNLGFGGGCNAGVQEARHRIVVLLNNDMRATPDFLPFLLEGFTDPDVFAVSAQIFFSDANRRREETGLTAGRFEKGFLRVRHVVDDQVNRLCPTLYGGGGSTAYDREKFLELGGFDPLFEPFYMEDTDLSYGAWRQGWKILYQPKSRFYHEHRATIGKNYSSSAIRAYLQKNHVLMVWKNIHRWRWLAQHLFYLYGHIVLCGLGQATETRTSMGAFRLALRQLRPALAARRRTLLRSRVNDLAVFERTRPSGFRDLFPDRAPAPKPESVPSAPSADSAGSVASVSPVPSVSSDGQNPPLNILFVSPYSIYPPLHGGAVLMWEAIRQLCRRHHVFLLTFVDRPEEMESNRELEGLVCKVEVLLRRPVSRSSFSLRSHAQRTFYDPEFAALLDKMVWLYDIDLIQFEYTQMAQYHLPLRHTAQCLFEHNVYFHAVQRELFSERAHFAQKAQQFVEWLRALRYEIGAVEKFDAVFTCHEEEQKLLESFLATRNGRRAQTYSGLRIAVEASSYSFPGGPRKPDSLLFVGNFQHLPNVQGLTYFCREIFPLIRARRPRVSLTVVGAQAPPAMQQMLEGDGIDLLGEVADIREPLSRHAVFICPIRTGAGVRVKILEAFASGIPVVSTHLGAEGLHVLPGTHLRLADAPGEFAAATLELLEQPDKAAAIAFEARQLVESTYDWSIVGQKLEEVYRRLVAERRG